jgi:hypothetical protein
MASLNAPKPTPIAIKDYLLATGWKLSKKALDDGLFLFTHDNYARRQLRLPVDASLPGATELIDIALSKLTDLVQKPLSILVGEISETNEDTLLFRLTRDDSDADYIPLEYAAKAIIGARELLLAASHSVLKPKLNHPRLNKADALKLVESTRFRHTLPGSFVLKVSCPIQAVDQLDAPFEPTDTDPFVRKVTKTINKAAYQLVTAIQTGTVQQFVEELRQAEAPLVSYNLCKAIGAFGEREGGGSTGLVLGFKWAAALAAPALAKQEIKIQGDYFSRIDEVRSELQRITEPEVEEVYIGTVEKLEGSYEGSAHREGYVTLDLYQQEAPSIRTRAYLSPDWHQLAIRAYETPGTFVQVKGKLKPGRQPRLLASISDFKIIGS